MMRSLSLAGIVIHLVNAVPLGKTLAFHDTIEIGFAMARGFSEAEAMLDKNNLQKKSVHLSLRRRLAPVR